MKVILEVKTRKKPNLPIEAESIVPKNFLDTDADLKVWKGNKELPLDEVFTKRVEGTASYADKVEVVIRGDSSRIKRVGEYMDAGKITIENDIGMHCGNFMSGGEIVIKGNAGSWLGREMQGGRIICEGNAGDFCGAGYRGEKKGMVGGLIHVMGDVGDFTAETLAGGTIIVEGDAGDLTGVDMRGGTLVIMGTASRVCGNMKEGTAYVHGMVREMIPTFRNKGTVEVDKTIYTKFTGDVANRGKGTLYVKNFEYMR